MKDSYPVKLQPIRVIFLQKKCISSRTPGGNWKIAISSNFFQKKLEEMADSGKITLFSIGCSEYVTCLK